MVNNLLSGDEILALAEDIEEKGMHFYREMAKKFAENLDIVTILERLADDEIEHKELFRSFRAEEKLLINVSPESVKYLKSLLQPSLFPKEGDQYLIKTPKDALGIGIEAEKAAILFYHELYEVIDGEQDRKIISKLLKEEKMHLVELRDYWDEL